MKKKRVLPALVAVTVVLLVVFTYEYIKTERVRFVSDDGKYEFEYPRSWKCEAAEGIVTLYNVANVNGYPENVTVVRSRMAPGWEAGFEESLAGQFAELNGKFTMLQTRQVTIHGKSVKIYVYSLSVNDKVLMNQIYIFQTGKESATVVTCSALEKEFSKAASQFENICNSFEFQT
ncbi:hypothetical protein G3N56_00470 [Desulfovibrio sulfodismutans]|uniref:PsbP C-terminal domain-containing protein n=1 Tax=Desulfolutivibrio sulfodismutans TaxID=63561 RepID=A0A7K3NJ25_9BACT|nr:PsbP-related protein [Desulfolutivibrio sulfodismutans]NDY55219.1 hypothetical protein [Desulfolutivibrio sulfodismutans]